MHTKEDEKGKVPEHKDTSHIVRFDDPPAHKDESEHEGKFSKFVNVFNSNPELRTVGITYPKLSQDEFRVSADKSVGLAKYKEALIEHNEDFFIAHPLAHLRAEAEALFAASEIPEEGSSMDIQGPNSDEHLRVLREEIQEKQKHLLRENPLFIKSITRVKEKPSSEKAEVVEIFQNIVDVGAHNQVTVRSSIQNVTEDYEIESGFAIFKSLNPIAYCPSYQNIVKKDRKTMPYASRVKELEMKESLDIFTPGSKQCTEYLPPIEYAELLITNTIRQAKEHYISHVRQYGDPEKKVVPAPLVYQNKKWASVNNMSKEDGIGLIELYIIMECDLREDWEYTIFLEGIQSDKVSDHYFYEANFSIPTKLYPIAQVTASVYFHMEVSRVIPPSCPIRVSLSVEGSRLNIHPDKFTLTDDILFRVLNTKLKIFKSIDF